MVRTTSFLRQVPKLFPPFVHGLFEPRPVQNACSHSLHEQVPEFDKGINMYRVMIRFDDYRSGFCVIHRRDCAVRAMQCTHEGLAMDHLADFSICSLGYFGELL